MKLNRRNSYPGRCCICDTHVAADAGSLIAASDSLDEAHRTGRKKWLTLCRSSHCVRVFSGEWSAAEGRRELQADGTIVLPYSVEALPLLQSIARAQLVGGVWRWMATRNPGDRARVLEIAARLGLDVHPSWRDETLPADLVDLAAVCERNGLFPYQVTGVRWLATRPRGVAEKIRGCILADEQGLGKTSQMLHLMMHASLRSHALVILCPKNAVPTWMREPGKWLPGRFTSVHVVQGSAAFRWPTHAGEVVVVNYESVPFTAAEIRKERETLLRKRFGAPANPQGKTKGERTGAVGLVQDTRRVIAGLEYVRSDSSEIGKRTRVFRELLLLAAWSQLSTQLHRNQRALSRNAKKRPIEKPRLPIVVGLDEAHYVCNTKARRSANATRVTAFADLVVGMTGTPAEQDPQRLRGLMSVARCQIFDWDGLLDRFSGKPGKWGGIEWEREVRPDGKRGAIKVKPGVADELRSIVLRREKKDELDLPPKLFSEIFVPVADDLTAEMDEIVRASIHLLRRGQLPLGQWAKTRERLEALRIPRMIEEIENYEAQDTPLVVFAAHRAPIDALRGRKGWGVITGDKSETQRKRTEYAFQAGDLLGVAGTIGAMATSLTLTRASHELFVGLSLRRSDNKQAEDRCHRIGQRDTVNIAVMISDHPLDQHCAGLLSAKDDFVRAVLDERLQIAGVSEESRADWLARLPDGARARYEREAAEIVARVDALERIAGLQQQ